ncbi:hypothetical protein DDP37_05100 [Helicobacter pylori]|nr:hypothetical protein DDP37_05100 [Helicobacter pylori]
MTKFSPNYKKKKTLYAIILQMHSNANAFLQMYFNECMKSLILIQFNPKRRKKHEKTHPFINFRLAFSFRIER